MTAPAPPAQVLPGDSLARWPQRHPGAALAWTCLLLTALASLNRFVQDDAFILFQYAANLAEGRGLVWLPGERVEGYTTFLWTLVLSIPFALHVDPVAFCHAAGLTMFAGTLLVTYDLAVTLLGSRGIALLALWLLGTNYTFSAYATGGLETQMQALFVLAGFALSFRVIADGRYTPMRLAGLSLLGAGALLTRLDSALLVGPPLAAVLWGLSRKGPGAIRPAGLAALALPGLVPLVGWLAWKVGYYGDVLPNTFYAKAGAITSLGRGVRYVLLFTREYALWPYLLGLALAAPAVARRVRGWPVILASCGLWLLYVIKVGGDFMEFRLFVPILPLCAVVAARMIAALRPAVAGTALLAATATASAIHGVTYRYELETDSVAMLRAQVADPERGWILAGRRLAEELGAERDSILLATTAAGAIPFYSRIPTLDMHGLMDPWIARHGAVRSSEKPGHQRLATLDYLIRRRVNLVLGHPIIRPVRPETEAYPVSRFAALEGWDGGIPSGARLVEMPLNSRYALTMLYLTPTPTLDSLVARRGWRTAPLASR